LFLQFDRIDFMNEGNATEKRKEILIQPNNPTIQIAFLAMKKIPVDITPQAYVAMTLHIDRVVVQLKRSATAIINYTGRQASSPGHFSYIVILFVIVIIMSHESLRKNPVLKVNALRTLSRIS
jgi:hypothetical protein